MAHRVTTAAVEAAAEPAYASAQPPWSVAKVYWTALSESALRIGLADPAVVDTGFDIPDPGHVAGALAPDQITAVVDASAFLEAKAAAMRAHATQITVRGDFYALSNNLAMPLTGVEWFRLVRGVAAEPFDRCGRETDLFAGVAQ